MCWIALRNLRNLRPGYRWEFLNGYTRFSTRSWGYSFSNLPVSFVIWCSFRLFFSASFQFRIQILSSFCILRFGSSCFKFLDYSARSFFISASCIPIVPIVIHLTVRYARKKRIRGPITARAWSLDIAKHAWLINLKTSPCYHVSANSRNWY